MRLMSDSLLATATFGSALAPPYIRIGKSGAIPPTAPHEGPPGASNGRGGVEGRQSLALSTPQAADYLGISPRTLEDWRFRGGGPVFRKIGKRLVRYRVDDLDAFLEHSARVNTGGGQPAR